MNQSNRERCDRLKIVFESKFGIDNSSPLRFFRAPGRVNLIGEHTDYNDGFVLPIAIDKDTVVAARKSIDATNGSSTKIRVFSANQEELKEFDLAVASQAKPHQWINYVEGVIRVLAESNSIVGADLIIDSNVPTGSGLSSSAALEISSGFAMLTLSDATIDLKKLAIAGQRAEHEYVGANVGIMDQFISAMGKTGVALLIDCRSLEKETVRIDTRNVMIVVCNTGVKHNLASSAYNDRRRECEEAVVTLRKQLPQITSLRDVSPNQLEQYAQALPGILQRRAKHVVTEIARTLEAAEALRHSDFNRMGQLMFESHASLRDDYQVSARELDVLVEQSRNITGVFGTRMTGGGFGGCTVSIIERPTIDSFTEAMTSGYRSATGLELEVYPIEIGNGVEELTW